MRKAITVVIGTLLIGLTSHAGLMIEPYVGYESGTMKQSGNPKLENTGAYYGARLGYDFIGFKLGIDFQTASQDIDQGGSSGEYEPTDMGAFIGYEFPIMLQIYASYFLDSKAKFPGATFPEEFSGSGTRIGLGWTGLPFISINLEVISRTYDEYDGTSLDDELKGSSTALSISLPIP